MNSQQQRIVSLSKNMLFPRELLYRKVITVKFSLNMQKHLGGLEKSEVWNGRSLIVSLMVGQSGQQHTSAILVTAHWVH